MDRFTGEEERAMRRALEAARAPGVPQGPNPRVGCVILDPQGRELARGHHRGSGTPHAETDALARLRGRARGATAVVTLEPCAHTGRTGPCARALIDAGVARVVYALADPNPVAAGGAEVLRAAGVDVAVGLLADEARDLNRGWLHGLAHGRPLVTWKLAASLDGRLAAADGTSQWITSATARRDAQHLRAQCDAIMIGTGTALADDPSLTVRDERGVPAPRSAQPLRVVVGTRELPHDARLRDDAAPLVILRDGPATGLAELWERGVRHVLLEGGPNLAASMVRAGLVDEVVAYVAPVLLGDGANAVHSLGLSSIDEALRLCEPEAVVLGEGAELTVRLRGRLPALGAPLTTDVVETSAPARDK